MQQQGNAGAVAPAAPVQGVTVNVPGANGATEVYQGLVAQRRELRNQLDRLEGERRDLQRQLQQVDPSESGRPGLEQRLTAADQRIAAVDKSLAEADAAVAKAAAVPGAVVEPPVIINRSTDVEELAGIGMGLSALLLFPVMIAYTRRIWRRSAKVVMTLPAELMERLQRLEESVESVAVEVERVGEGQRFMTRVLAEVPEARGVITGAREPEPERVR